MVSPASSADGSESDAVDAAAADAPALPVIIACSTEDQGAADNAAGGLRERGFRVEVVGEAEAPEHRLDEVVEELEGKGLYVLCRGGTLDRAGIDGLRDMLRQREVPFGRTLTLATGHGGARALEERIVSVARRMVTGSFEQVPAPPKTGLGGKSPAQSSPPPAEPESETELQTEVVVAGVDESDVDRWADSLAHGERVALAAEEDGPGLDADEGDPADEDAFYEQIDKTLVSLAPEAEPIPASEVAAFEPPDASATTEPAPAAPAPPPDAAEDVDTEYTSFDGGNMRLFVGGAAAIMITIALIAYFASGTEDAEPKADEKAEVVAKAGADDAEAEGADAGAGEAEPAADAPEDAAPEDAAPEAPEPEEPEPAAEKPEAPEPEPEPAAEEPEPVAEEPEAEPEPESDVSAELAALAAIDPEAVERALAHRSQVDPALLDDGELSPGAPGDDAVVASALSDREIRAWNVFLLAGDDAPTMSFSDAETFCKTLTVADVTGWRLPSIGELSSLSGAKVLSKAVFWSETPGDAFGDTRMVLNSRKGSMSSVRADWDGAKPICVRVRS